MHLARLALAATSLVFLSPAARSQEVSFNAMADVRLLQPSNQRSGTDGGLGKLRFNGGSNAGPDLTIGEIVGDGRVQFSPEFALLGTLRYAPDQHKEIDLLEGYARYRTVSSADWMWQVKLGAFFPPISLENEGVGWSSPWTLTPSAINSWVGEELRTFGGESSVQWRYDSGT